MYRRIKRGGHLYHESTLLIRFGLKLRSTILTLYFINYLGSKVGLDPLSVYDSKMAPSRSDLGTGLIENGTTIYIDLRIL